MGEVEGPEGLEQPTLARALRLADALGGLISEASTAARLDAVAGLALEMAPGGRALLALRESADGPLLEAQRGFQSEAPGGPISIARNAVDLVLRDGDPVHSPDVLPGASPSVRARSLTCLPIRAGGRVAGALYIENRYRPGGFDAETVRLLAALAGAAGAAIEAAGRLRDAESRTRRIEEESIGLRGAVETQQLALARMAEVPGEPHGGPIGGTSDDREEKSRRIIGRSPAIRRVLGIIRKAARGAAPVLISGESGSGKELVARAVHAHSPRAAGPFVAESFAALPETLAESELFGHVRGAFTGAIADRAGLFEQASGGTLFLDEVGDCSLSLQKKLLRVLQEGEVRRVGGEATARVDVRIVAATHRDLLAETRAGRFREDLYFRLAVVPVRVPPLRERAEDVPALVAHFLDRLEKQEGHASPGISREALRMLMRRPWPGNVRELENAVRRLAALGGPTIGRRDVEEILGPSEDPRAERISGASTRPLLSLASLERAHVERVLAACGGRPIEAARVLGISYPTLWRRMKAWRAGT